LNGVVDAEAMFDGHDRWRFDGLGLDIIPVMIGVRAVAGSFAAGSTVEDGLPDESVAADSGAEDSTAACSLSDAFSTGFPSNDSSRITLA
jgi:hypothetical protein